MAKLKKLFKQQSVRIVLLYVIFSVIWITYTDKIVEQLFTDSALITQIQTIKGWFFVMVSGVVLYWIFRKSGREIEENRDQYKAMLDDAKVGIARLENLHIVSSNPAFRTLLGRSENDLKELAFTEFIVDADREKFLNTVDSLSFNEYAQQELKLKINKNNKRWVQINLSKHSGEEAPYIHVILQDINDRKTFQAYTELLLQVLLTLEPTDNFNAALKGILKNLCEELNWEYGTALIPDERSVYKKEVSWYRLDPLLDEYDFKMDLYRFKKGEGLAGLTVKENKSIWVEDLEKSEIFKYKDAAIEADLRSVVSIPLVINEEVIAVLVLFSREFLAKDEDLLKLLTAIGHDIGIKLEKRKQQDEKQELERSLNYALKSAVMATWDIDLETGDVIRSHNHNELFGLKKAPETWNVKDMLRTIIEEDREKVEKSLNEAVIQTKGYNEEFRIKKNGNIRWLWSRGNLLYDTYGEPERLSGVITDITNKKQLQIYTELLLEITLSIESLKDPDKAFDNILRVICNKSIWQYGEIWQYRGESGEAVCTNNWYDERNDKIKSFGLKSMGLIFDADTGLPGIGANSDELIWISNISRDARFIRKKEAKKAGFKSVVAIPINVEGVWEASILLFTKYEVSRDKDSVNFLKAIRNNIGIKLAKKKTELELDRERELLEMLYKNIPVMITIYRPDFSDLRVNAEFEKVTGWKNGDLAGVNLFDEMYPDKKTQEKVRDFMNHPGSGWMDIEMRVRSGDIIQTTWTNVRLSDDTQIGIGLDITDRKLMEKELKEQQYYLSESQRIANLGTYRLNLETGRAEATDTLKAVFGYPPDHKLVLDNWNETLHPDHKEMMKDYLDEVIREKKRFEKEYKIIRASDKVERWVFESAEFEFDEKGNPVELIGSVQDITRRKEYELEIKKSETLARESKELMRKMFESLEEAVIILNPGTRTIVDCNLGTEKIFGYSREELIGESTSVLYPDEKSFHQFHDLSLKDLEKSGIFQTEFRLQKKNGDLFISDHTVTLVYDDEDNVDRIVSVVRDITERKKHEDQIRRHRDRLLEAEKVAKMGHWEMILSDHQIQTDDNRIYLSDTMFEIFGFEEQNFDGTLTEFMKMVHPDDRSEVIDTVNNQMAEGHINVSFRVVKPSGDVIHTHAIGEVEFNSKGEPALLKGVNQDITDIYRIEEELIENQKRLQLATTSANVGLWEWYPESGKTVFDEIWARLVGYTLEELEPVGIETWNELVHPDDLIKFEEAVESYRKGETPLFECEVRMKHKSGHWVWILDRGRDVEWDEAGNPLRMVGTHIDVTERKDAEEIQKYNSLLLKNISEAVIAGDEQLRITSWNERATELYGWTFEEVRGKTIRQVIHTEYLNHTREEVDQIFRDKGEWKGEVKQGRKDGTVIYVLSSVKAVVNDEGKVIGSLAVNRDITDLKKFEEKLAAERQRFEMAVDEVSDVVWDYDAVEETLWWNEGIETVFGYNRQEIQEESEFWEKHIYEEDQDETIQGMREAEQSDAAEWSASYRFLDAEGNIREVEDSARIIRDENGNLKRIIGAMVDVTELKNFQRDLLEERKRFEIIAESTNDIIYDLNLETDELWANEEINSIMGYDLENFDHPMDWWEEHIHPDDRDRVIQSQEEFFKTDKQKWTNEYRFIGTNDAELHIQENAFVIRDEEGKAIRMLGAMIDVTAEKETERVLRESEEQYRRLFEQNPYPMWIFDSDSFEILQVNQSTIDKYGYSKKEFDSLTIFDLHPPEEREGLDKLFTKQKNSLNHYEEMTHITRNDKKLIVNITTLDIRYKGKIQRLVVANDVTEQKKAEEKIIGSVIEGSENERRRIAKELHDGLGQHLTAASMNLDSVYEELQSLPQVKWNQYEKGLKLIRDAIVESRRISQNLLPKAIEDFGLSLAVQSLVDDFKGNNDITITYRDNLEGVNLDETVELNIYRIIQEGINNAVRHSDCSRIDIQIILDDQNLICTIEDNGKGFDLKTGKSEGLGLKSIRNRVNAMSGEVEFSSSAKNGSLISVIVSVNIV